MTSEEKQNAIEKFAEQQESLKEMKATFTHAFYDYPDWCHTSMQARCEELGEMIKRFIEKESKEYLPELSAIGFALVEAVFECKDIVVNIEGEKDV